MLTLTPRFAETLAWVCEIHAGQRRKFHQDPYVSHPLRVCGMLMEWTENEDEILAALLHDAAEDCGGQAMLDEIERRLGPYVAFLVKQCSDSLAADSNAKSDWRARKEAHLARTAAAEPGAKRIMLCDKIDNLRAIVSRLALNGEEVFSHFHGGHDILWYFRSMYDVLAPGAPQELVRELKRCIDALEDAERTAVHKNS